MSKIAKEEDVEACLRYLEQDVRATDALAEKFYIK